MHFPRPTTCIKLQLYSDNLQKKSSYDVSNYYQKDEVLLVDHVLASDGLYGVVYYEKFLSYIPMAYLENFS